MSRLKAVIFDIDGTLSPEVSWLALTRGLGASVERHIQIYSDYREGKIDYITSKTRLIDLWSETGNANKLFFSQLFEDLPLDPAAEKVVQLAKTDRQVCLITGSMDLYAQTVANKLGITHWRANTTLHWDEHGDLTDMDYDLDQARKKLEQFGRFCRENDLEAQDCLVIGDGENDEWLFAACGHGVLLEHGRGLTTKTQAWKRITRLADLERILQRY